MEKPCSTLSRTSSRKTGVHQNRELMEKYQKRHEELYGPYYHCDKYDLFKMGLIPNTTDKEYENSWKRKRKMQEGKVCSKCKVWKPFSEFGRGKDTKLGYRSACKECERKRKNHM